MGRPPPDGALASAWLTGRGLDVADTANRLGGTPGAEAMLDQLIAQAIAAWRIEEAVFWQRVRIRCRRLRTRPPDPGGPNQRSDST